jgi:hypothetical protein
MESQLKRIILPETGSNFQNNQSTGKKKIENKEKEKRKVTQRKQWNFDETELTNEMQRGYIDTLYDTSQPCDAIRTRHIHAVIENQIKAKIQGYYQQDIKKKLYDENKFITLPKVIELLHTCKNTCYYCREPVLILYEYVRDNKQWSLERRDNSRGHNHDNVEIACLHCNICRKTMNEERYLFTKQLNIIKQS